MNAIFSPVTNKAYFKKHGKLYEAPFDIDTKNIDFMEVAVVDYFFLTPLEFENAMEMLNALEEYEVQ
jgi:guanylate kinase